MSCDKKTKIKGIRLSSQEISTLWALLKESSYEKIAKRLSVSVGTVRYHIENTMSKFGEKTKEDLVNTCRQHWHTLT